MQKQRYTLMELERDLGIPVGDLFHFGADGELTLHVIADKWPGKKEGNADAESDVIVDEAVELLPTDLLKALNSEYTNVRQVKTADGDVVVLDSTRKVMRGDHFVTAVERDRVQKALKPSPKPTVVTSNDASPPYLDRSHYYYSDALEAAVSAWMALYADGGFKKRSLGGKAQIESWLKKHRPDIPSDYAREGIATVVNPNKKGGNPLTKK